jgi:hypothetical protein
VKHVRVNGPFSTAAVMVLAVGLAFTAPARALAGEASEGLLAADAKADAAPTAKPDAKPKKSKEPKQPKAPAHVHYPNAGPWDQGATWVGVRAGYSSAAYRTAASGNFGYGFGFSRMVSPKWALAGVAEHVVLGKFGNASETEIPFTLELDRHVGASSAFRFYYGFGGGTYYHKFSNTGADASHVMGGGLICIGANAVASAHSVLGVDARVAFLSTLGGAPADNPVFGPQSSSVTHWSYRVTWSVTY